MKTGRNVFLTGAAGSGKTHVLNGYIAHCRAHRIPIAVTASTGIAATHIGGVTAHSWSGIGVRTDFPQKEIAAIAARRKKKLQNAAVLIIDEISMLSARALSAIDAVCRHARENDAPFGGMQVVFSGDFFQLPPVSRETKEEYAYESESWRDADLRTCYLTEQHRHDDEQMSAILNGIRERRNMENIAAALRARHCEPKEECTRLHTHNKNVDEENARKLDLLPGNPRVFQAALAGRAAARDALLRSVLAPENLALKKGAVVMFVKNNPAAGYHNGTVGVVENFERDIPLVRTKEGKIIAAHREEWRIENEEGKTIASLSQIPLRLAWAMTVHKSQGMSMSAAEMDLSRCFVPGQGYVALSRVRTLSGVYLRGMSREALAVDPRAADFDARAQGESKRWERAFDALSEEKIAHMKEEFILACGGTLEEREPEKEKVSTYEKTRTLLSEKSSIADIAAKRGLTEGTIISHIEKLARTDGDLDISFLKPPEEDFTRMARALKNARGGRLSAAHRALKGKYSFDDLRIARIFLEKESGE